MTAKTPQVLFTPRRFLSLYRPLRSPPCGLRSLCVYTSGELPQRGDITVIITVRLAFVQPACLSCIRGGQPKENSQHYEALLKHPKIVTAHTRFRSLP